MELTMKDILDFPSLEQGQLITGNEGLNNRVTNTMVMEALDIEDWGRAGLVLLTSYFAFKDSTAEAIDLFFSKAKKIGVAGFIFKTERLVTDIPAHFISACHDYELSLIQIPKEMNYEKIINEILTVISNNHAFLLERYYENHQDFIQLMMNQAELPQILKTLEDLIHLPVTLSENINAHHIGTDKDYEKFKIISELPIEKETHQNINYQKYLVSYPNINETKVMVSSPIPNLGYEDYELLIHGVDHTFSDLQLTAVENAIVALQIELVKRYALRQHNTSHLNEMAYEFISDRLVKEKDINDTIQNLRLDTSKNYRVVIFDFKHLSKTFSPSELNRVMDRLIKNSKNYFYDVLYIKRAQQIILIVPIIDFTLDTIKSKLMRLFDYFKHKVTENAEISKVTISDEVSVYNLPQGYKQARDIIIIGNLWENKSPIISYDEIGIFKLFIETENIDSMKDFVPEKLWQLAKNNPELLNTLYTFINANQKYSVTAERLFIHPKTVRYRVEQLENQYQINFENSEEIMYYNIAIRIIKYLQYMD